MLHSRATKKISIGKQNTDGSFYVGSKLTKDDKQLIIFNLCELRASVVHFYHKDTKDTKFLYF